MGKTKFWLSYDLSLNGDYEGMYTFLDNQNAVECGDSLACFDFEYKSNPIDELKSQLDEQVDLKIKDRIYVTYLKEGHISGRFIYGRRKTAPWEGYAKDKDNTADEDSSEV